jgi:hypothetical protein
MYITDDVFYYDKEQRGDLKHMIKSIGCAVLTVMLQSDIVRLSGRPVIVKVYSYIEAPGCLDGIRIKYKGF